MVNQCESAITMECPEDLSDDQVIKAEAYAALYALGGYMYNNVVHEVFYKQCYSANSEEEDTDNESNGEEGGVDTNPKTDEEKLINQKSPYEQKFIREHRELFSESLNPSRYLKCPPMKIKLKQALSSKLDPSLYRFKPRTIPMHIKA